MSDETLSGVSAQGWSPADVAAAQNAIMDNPFYHSKFGNNPVAAFGLANSALKAVAHRRLPAANAAEPEDDCSCGGGDLSGHDGMCPYAHEPAASAPAATEMEASDAPVWYGPDEASAWANGYNAGAAQPHPAASAAQGPAGSVGVEELADWFYDNGHEFVVSDEEDVSRAILDKFEVRLRGRSQPETDDLAGKLRAAHQDKLKLWEAIAGGPEPRCRDCADFNGKCQGNGLPCDPQERALERVKQLRAQLAETEQKLAQATDRVERCTAALQYVRSALNNPQNLESRAMAYRAISASLASTDGARPTCKLCGLEDGACICRHLPPHNRQPSPSAPDASIPDR
ncbi:hypothetical protein [Bradyrhizobium sp. Tv2a-2]|uniref:hypothetical protein n=1 Tax=Bradyrhizobium sp. Tv2a-2 TaxID=113395 RepID=UPI00040EE178|nr:hypothetical protein [Bradyrhizobium sp. Tv2a-2]